MHNCLSSSSFNTNKLKYPFFARDTPADWTFILRSELPTKELPHLPRKMPPQASQTSQYVAPRGGIFLGKWRSSFAGSSFVNRTIQLWNQLPADALGTLSCKPSNFRKRIRKVINKAK
jgi:hypothetical protein